MPFTPGPYRTRDGTAATVTRVIPNGPYCLEGFIGGTPHTWAEDGSQMLGLRTPLDLLYRDEPGDEAEHCKETAMPAHENTHWDYDQLQRGIAHLEWAEKHINDDTGAANRAMRHTIEFVQWNIEQGEILSPLQVYLTQK